MCLQLIETFYSQQWGVDNNAAFGFTVLRYYNIDNMQDPVANAREQVNQHISLI